MRYLVLAAVVAMGFAACAGGEDETSDPVAVLDSATGCEGDGEAIRYQWSRDGDWYVRGGRRVPAGVVTRLRELALAAPGIAAPLPAELRITAEVIEERREDIIEAAARWSPWLLDSDPPEFEFSRIIEVARRTLIDLAMDTDYSVLTITLPGSPEITISSESQSPYMQPWQVVVGDAEARKVLSLEISRYAMLFTDPAGPNYRYLEGARYWADGFWADEDVWSRAYGREWNGKYARELCTELPGWDEVEGGWKLRDADIGSINRQPLSLQPDLRAKGDLLVSFVRWWNPIEDDEPQYDWSDFLDVHERANKAARRLRCLLEWKSAGPGRTVSLDAVGGQGHGETNVKFFHEPVWKHADLSGDPEFELLLRIDGKCVATLLLGHSSNGAVLLDGHESLSGMEGVDFHPTVGEYAILRPDGRVEQRRMPPIRAR